MGAWVPESSSLLSTHVHTHPPPVRCIHPVSIFVRCAVFHLVRIPNLASTSTHGGFMETGDVEHKLKNGDTGTGTEHKKWAKIENRGLTGRRRREL